MLARIDGLNPVLNAYVTVAAEAALADAEAADRRQRAGERLGPLDGLPVAIKDNIATKGLRTTVGSALYRDWVPDRDATVVARLRAAGAVILGKTGTHEFAYGTTSMNPFFGRIANPWDIARDPGGSSGGSAAAVAAGLAFAALGTDTACSIRHPGHCCGVIGFKPSFGLVSAAGVLPLVRTMDHVGPLTRTVECAALVTAAIAGPDEADPYSSGRQFSWPVRRQGGVAGVRLGIARDFFFDGDPEIVDLVDRAIRALEAQGAVVVHLDSAGLEDSLTISSRLFAEAYAFHAGDLAARPQAFGVELQAKLERKSLISAAEYIEAGHERLLLRARMDRLMEQCDVMVAPTATIMPACFDDRPDDYDQHASKNATVFNLTGQPSITVPCGFSASGLPVGMMMSGAIGCDAELLAIAGFAERVLMAARPSSSPLFPYL
jgi:aspartyl-tRNA(Asn)/glutamyl-tRNA(Gln) amidotransferase subunit A